MFLLLFASVLHFTLGLGQDSELASQSPSRVSSAIPASSTAASTLHVSSSSSATLLSPTIVLPTCIPSTNLPTAGASFPPVGSISRDYSEHGLSELWDVVGPVTAPPFTTTVEPTGPVALPSSPPALYPSWFAPEPKDILPDLKLPEGFLMGVATAAYQVEGAAKNEGKAPSMWDWATRQPGAVLDNTTADVVDLQYYLYKTDVDRLAALGLNAHSFSLSWARILPFGAAGSPVNQQGIDHYRDLIDYHIKANVTPVVTLFHWDTPLALQAYYGGFTSEKIVDDYVNYAKTVFAAYNGSVKTWYTFNEPRVFCSQIAGYPFNTTFAPGVNTTTAPFICSYHVLKSHLGAVKAFREMNIVGEIAYKNDDYVPIPWTNSTEDIAASERHTAFQIGVFADPVFSTGDWPKILTDTLPPDFLPRFTDEEKAELKGAADFFAVDAYRRQYVSAPPDGLAACVNNTAHPLWPTCNVAQAADTNGWQAGWSSDPLTSWLQGTPVTLRDSLKQYYQRWPSKKMIISEFGFSEPYEGVRSPPVLSEITEDVARTNYFMTYLGQVLLSIHEDKLPIAGTFAWALLDNAEWNSGLSARFGIQYVNYTSPDLERVYKRSALSLSEFYKAHKQ